MESLMKLEKLLKEQNKLLKENNEMLHAIIDYINIKEGHYHDENEEDMFRNIIANLISTKIDLRH